MSRTAPISLEKTPPPAAVRIGMRIRRALHRAGDRLLPPEVLAWEKVTSLQTTSVIAALVEVGAIDSLGRRAAGPTEVAAELDLDADTLGRVLRQGADDGLLRRRRNGAYELTALGEAYRSEHSPTISHWAKYMNTEAVQRAWGTSPRRSGPASRRSRRPTADRSGITLPPTPTRSASSPTRCGS